MIYDIRQFRFGDSDITKIQLSAVSSANEFRQETNRSPNATQMQNSQLISTITEIVENKPSHLLIVGGF